MLSVAIIGPGAVGSTIAYELQQSISNATLIGKHAKTLTYYTVPHAPAQDITVMGYDDITNVFNVIIIAVKTHQLSDVIPHLIHLAHEDTLIILAQNGHGQLERIPYKHVYQAVVYISGQKKDNVVTHFRDYQIRLQDTALTRQFKDLVQNSHIDVVLEANIQQAIWYKLLVNLGINSITALGRQTVAIMHNPEIRMLCRQLLEDGCRVAQAEGLDFSEQTVDTIMSIYQGYPDEMGTSMYYDIMHHQPLEVEAIQGFIYRRARAHKLDTPYLDTIYSFLKAYQQQL
ncbi:oxidoreductase [Staphylococcus argenteus]|uniref:oxidoreductase n=1 Tax=Staphylococcus argenteus TaxID=985002 RepID=UPI000B590127|nr:oxidoreductase [Staphylococcus argenteus]